LKKNAVHNYCCKNLFVTNIDNYTLPLIDLLAGWIWSPTQFVTKFRKSDTYIIEQWFNFNLLYIA